MNDSEDGAVMPGSASGSKPIRGASPAAKLGARGPSGTSWMANAGEAANAKARSVRLRSGIIAE